MIETGFTGGTLDRADHVRTDAAAYAAALRHPDARLLQMDGLAALIHPDGAPGNSRTPCELTEWKER